MRTAAALLAGAFLSLAPASAALALTDPVAASSPLAAIAVDGPVTPGEPLDVTVTCSDPAITSYSIDVTSEVPRGSTAPAPYETTAPLDPATMRSGPFHVLVGVPTDELVGRKGRVSLQCKAGSTDETATTPFFVYQAPEVVPAVAGVAAVPAAVPSETPTTSAAGPSEPSTTEHGAGSITPGGDAGTTVLVVVLAVVFVVACGLVVAVRL